MKVLGARISKADLECELAISAFAKEAKKKLTLMKTSKKTTRRKNMSRRFDYVKYDEKAAKQQASFKDDFQIIEGKVEQLKEGRAKSLAMTHLEIAYMWVGKALRDECIERNPETNDVPERTNV